MATFVLVHGAWLGGWVWRHVTPRLRAHGHLVHAPTLTGLGERVHLASPAVGLETHVSDVVNLLEYEDLDRVVLVGHSYAGIVVTGAADRVPARIGQLVYLDAFVPDDGQSLHDLVPAGGAAHSRDLAAREGDGWRIPLEAEWRTGPAWMHDRWTDQPLRCFEEGVRLSGAAAHLPRTYVRCTENAATGPLFDRFAREPGWRVRELTADHAAMATAPEALSELLLDLL
jgi:pimeloyl-ACP methyl ester carboxylesterase